MSALAAAVALLLVALTTSPAGAVPPPRGGGSAAARPTLGWNPRVISAGGVRQWIECSGAGPVTVVVIPGLGATHTMWSKVLPSFATTTRTCVYERPGVGSSPPRSPHAVVSALTHAGELWALLSAAGERGPFVLVAHSYGGLVARAFMARYGSHVAGLMLVEGVAPYDQGSTYWHEGGDPISMPASSRAAAAMPRTTKPLLVESAQDPNGDYWGGPSYGETAAEIADWRAHQEQATHLSTNVAWVVVARSRHVIEHDRPDAVIAGLRLVVHAAVTHTPLPACALGAYGQQPRCA